MVMGVRLNGSLHAVRFVFLMQPDASIVAETLCSHPVYTRSNLYGALKMRDMKMRDVENATQKWKAID